ncbi:MAG: SDR family oxidoreductase [Actinobacteria bacterium]|jgi:3-oxoacyl-[acyl-carrier protein] reductase|nr:SDR family oxidoreductase [Actinomycetota bacterium]
MAGRLEGKVAIVTGAGRGIGKAIAEAFVAEGARVVVNDVDADAANLLVKELGDGAVAENSAIGTVAAAGSVVGTALDTWGQVDILVNNAGILRDKMTHKMSEEDFDQVIQVHLKGTWACGREVIKLWRPLAKEETAEGRPHRKIVNVTSPSGLLGAVGQSNYAAAKMGIVGLTKTWAKELGSLSINVNAVSPTALTAMTEPLIQDPAQKAVRLARFALGRYGDPEEIAPSFVFLASKESDYITGQILCVDGGLVI